MSRRDPSTGRIGNRLVEAGVVRDRRTFQVALWISGRSRSLRAGEYRFEAPMHALDVIDKIARGDVYRRRLTFREGLTIAEMAQVFEERGFGAAADFRKAAENRGARSQELDPEARDLEGYLFPETYALPRGTTRGGRGRANGRRVHDRADAGDFAPTLRPRDSRFASW